MTLVAKKTGGDYTPAPAGTHLAICTRVIDIGTQVTPFKDENGNTKSAHQVIVTWELCHEMMEDGRPFTLSKYYTLSLHEKATLRHHLEAWRGKVFSEEELDGFHLKNILGKPCLLSVTHELKKDGSTRANVGGVMAVTKGTTPPAQQNASLMFDIDEWNQPTFDSLGEYLQKSIQASEEYKARFGGGNGTSNGVRNGGAPIHEPLSEDDIPF